LSLKVVTILPVVVAQDEDQLFFSEITVQMYVLNPDNGASTGESCGIDDPSTPQNEADDRYGCTVFDREHYPPDQVHPYPYAANPATVSIEDDYLLDVVPREMGPSGHHPLALRAQAIVARTYAYCAIHAREHPDTNWPICAANRWRTPVPSRSLCPITLRPFLQWTSKPFGTPWRGRSI